MSEEPGESVPEASAAAARTVPPNGMRTFLHVLVNTAAANITTSYLWFALTFWVYLETGSVLATGIIGGAYMLLLAVFGMVFGTLVDRHRKHRVMVVSALFSLVAFAAAGGLYLSHSEAELLDLGAPWFWLFSGIILAGAVVENLRNIALSTTVTLLVPTERHANANGLVGTVGGLAFLVTSVLSGFSVGRSRDGRRAGGLERRGLERRRVGCLGCAGQRRAARTPTRSRVRGAGARGRVESGVIRVSPRAGSRCR